MVRGAVLQEETRNAYVPPAESWCDVDDADGGAVDRCGIDVSGVDRCDVVGHFSLLSARAQLGPSPFPNSRNMR
jgi:hypothetical protein